MSFLSPAFLWGLTLLVPLIAVYLLKVRPRRRPTAALFLWEQVFTQKKANALLQRLRDVLSLLLLAFALIALVSAAARPRFDAGDDRDVLVLVDRSLSMSADFDASRPGHSRFDEAVDRAASLMRSLGGQRRAAIATVDQALQFSSLLTEEPRRLREALAALTPGEQPSDGESLRSIRAMAGLGDALRVVLLTDGVGLGESDLGLIEARPQPQTAAGDHAYDDPPVLEVVYLGPNNDADRPGNLGFAAADLIAGGEGSTGALLFSLASSFAEPVDAEVRLVSVIDDSDEALEAGLVVKVVPIRVEPGVSEVPQLLGVETGAGRYALTVTPLDEDGKAIPDALALDDVAYLSVPELRPLRVAVDTSDRYFFETAVRAFEQTGGLLALANRGEPADVSITRGGDRGVNAPLRIVFAPQAAADMSQSEGEALTDILPEVLLPDHPVLRFLSPDSMRFAGARSVQPPPGSAVLVADVTGVPLIWQHRDVDTGVVSLVINLEPAAGDFVLSPAFPVLVYAAAADLGGRDTAIRATYPTGNVASVPSLTAGASAVVTAPNGNTQTVTERRAEARMDTAGFYVAATPSGVWDLPASVLHPAESSLQTPEYLMGLPAVALPGGYPPWAWLTLLGLLIVVVEEVLYHRRKVG